MEDAVIELIFTHCLVALVGIVIGWVMAFVPDNMKHQSELDRINIKHQCELSRIKREMLEYEQQLIERVQNVVDDIAELPRPKIL